MSIPDICVVGGGPAGMIAAARAAELGAQVVLLEKNPELGRKLSITGGGRCNVTNAEFRRHVLVEKYGDGAQALHSLFSRFGPQETIELLARFGLRTVEEAEKRVFPETHRAASVLEVLRRYLDRGRVEIRTRVEVTGFTRDDGGRIDRVHTAGGQVAAPVVILATGGASRPDTGSTGEGFAWLATLGHTIRIPEPSLVPVRVAEAWIDRLQGLSFDDVRLTARLAESDSSPGRGSAARVSERGKLLFTHFGLSGPLVLNLSTSIAALARDAELPDASVHLAVDLLPSVDHAQVDAALREAVAATPNKKVKNIASRILPDRMLPVLCELCGVDPDLPAHSLPRERRKALVQIIKALPLTFAGLLGNERAVVSSGGLALDEVDFRTMRSKRVANLFVAGDMLDFNRRSGGYSLQICWSSGWLAGQSAAEQIGSRKTGELSPFSKTSP